MSDELTCSKAFEDRLYRVRDTLYSAVEGFIAKDDRRAQEATKAAYEDLSTLLNGLSSNLKPRARNEVSLYGLSRPLL